MAAEKDQKGQGSKGEGHQAGKSPRSPGTAATSPKATKKQTKQGSNKAAGGKEKSNERSKGDTIRRSSSCGSKKEGLVATIKVVPVDNRGRSLSPITKRDSSKAKKKGNTKEKNKPTKSGNNELSIKEGLKDISDDEENGKKNPPNPHDPRSPRSSAGQSSRTPRARTAPSSTRSGRETPVAMSPRQKASRDGRARQKEFFKEELKRLKLGLRKESEKIVAPPIKEHIPYVFNTLEPYYDVGSARFLIELPEPARTGYVSRQTAIGLCDPWDNHRMDSLNLLPPVVDTKQTMTPDKNARLNRKNGRPTQRTTTATGQKERPPKEGSTRLPKFPAVRIATSDLNSGPMFYNQVPNLRTKLRDKYSSCASDKVKEDYKRTKQDFFRMELDRMDAYHPSNRPNMRKSYFAYLQNTPGSRQAVYECVSSFEKTNQNQQQNKAPPANQDVAS